MKGDYLGDASHVKNFTMAFVKDFKMIIDEGINTYATYDDDGIPTMKGINKSVRENPLSFELINSFKEDEDEVAGHDGLHRVVAAPFWKDCGYPIFTLTSELAASLLLTELPSDVTGINPPFPAFMIFIKDPTPLVVDDREFHTIMFFEMATSDDLGNVPSWCTWTMPRGQASCCDFQKILDPRKLIGEWSKEHPSTRPVNRLIVNLFAYIAAKRDHGGGLPAMKKQTFGFRKGMKHAVLGRDIRIKNPEQMIEAARDSCRTGASTPHNKRYVVIGHFRNQHVGKRGEGGRKRIWIMPHWKGPDILEATERSYSVE